MLQIVEFNVNGKDYEIAVTPGELLVDTLRIRLGLTSVKKGCSVGECGACAVLIDGVVVNSCIYLTEWAEHKQLITVEGLRNKDNSLHPVQKAFIEEAAVQCGFCTPGFILTAVEIVGHRKNYTRDEIRRLISGHLCRCTGYENIINAIERAVKESHKP